MNRMKLIVAPFLLGTTICGFGIAAHAQDGVTVTTQESLENPDAKNWIMVHGNYAGHRFSPLTQITKENMNELEAAYTLAIAGSEGGGSRYGNAQLEGTPVVEDGYMYFPNGWGAVYKIDVHGRRQGIINWVMDPQIDKPWAGDVACCGIDNRGVALYRDKVISIALDGRMFAINKGTGEVEWERKIADPAIAETLTVAPQVIRNVGIVGPAGAEYGIRGYLDGTNLDDGSPMWRTYTVAGPGEPGGETWIKPDTYKTGGGSIWVTGTYDPKLNLAYWGIGNPGPDWDAEFRPGDNLYTDSVLAITPETGAINWFFQYTPNDPYDYDEIGEHPLVQVEVNGEMRDLVIHAARNGHFYAFDRVSGQFLFAKQYVETVGWTEGIDPKTGKPVSYDPAAQVQQYVRGSASRRDGTVGTQCPLITGGKNWEPAAYHPGLKMLFIPGGEGCQQIRTVAMEAPPADEREVFMGADFGGPAAEPANPTWKLEQYGSIAAVDVTTGELKQKYRMIHPQRSGIMVTAADWLMVGEPDGTIRALDALDMSKELWSFNVGTPIKAPPMSYEVDGVQYVAILVGAPKPGFDVGDQASIENYAAAHMLYVFRLDEDLL